MGFHPAVSETAVSAIPPQAGNWSARQDLHLRSPMDGAFTVRCDCCSATRGLEKIGSSGGICAHDLLLMRETRYTLRHGAIGEGKRWLRRQDLHQRRSPSESDVLLLHHAARMVVPPGVAPGACRLSGDRSAKHELRDARGEKLKMRRLMG